MSRIVLALGILVLLSSCKDPVAPIVPMCTDDFRPAMCMDGEEECETDDRGCRVCFCERDPDAKPMM